MVQVKGLSRHKHVLPNRNAHIGEFDRRLRKHVVATGKIRADMSQKGTQPWRRYLPTMGNFTTKRFDHDAPIWAHYFKQETSRITNCLAVGTWEGRSLNFTAHLFPNARLTCIDTFGSDAVSELERRFTANIEPIRDRATVLKGTSFERLAMLLKGGGESFDFIYIDGTHFFRHVLTDTMKCWPMLNVGGILIWDDQLWTRKLYRKYTSKAPIDFFLDMYEGDDRPSLNAFVY
jgi:Methyltransferase domain